VTVPSPQPVPIRYALYPDGPETRPPGAAALLEVEQPRPAFNRVLSLALAMRGGVSLAVWIGGCVAEIDIIRRVRVWRDGATLSAYFIADLDLPAEQLPMVLARADRYARLLMSRGYDRMEVDVLAGASAGGLNAVLYSVAQRAGVAVDGLLELWLESGAIWALLRDSSFRSVPSVLSGDFFWGAAVGAMHSFYTERTAHPLHRTKELTVDLSATITDAGYRGLPGSPQGRGHLHFVGTVPTPAAADVMASRPSTTGRDIPLDWSPDTAASIQRLGYAARTTSSFPGAFEQASIWSPTTTPRGAVPADPPSRPTDPPAVNMTFAFSAHRVQTDPAAPQPIRTMDGGILDNIPVDRVYRAIKDRISDSVGGRIVVYLDPTPDMPVPQVPPTVSDPPRFGVRRRVRPTKQSFIGTIINGIFMRGISESGTSEVADLEAAVNLQQQAQLRARALGGLTSNGVSWKLSSAARSYVETRAATDSQLIGSVLADPDLWQLTTDLPTRMSWDPTDPSDLRLLAAAFASSYSAPGAALATGGIRRGSQALRDAALCLSEWFDEVERRLPGGGPHDTDEERAQRDQLRLSIHELAIAARRLRDANVDRMLSELRPLGTGDVPALDAYEVAARWLDLEARTETTAAWQALDRCLVEVRTSAAPLQWSSFPSTWDATGLPLAAAPRGIPDPLRIDQFATITANEPSSFTFSPLVEAQWAETVSHWLNLPRDRFLDEARERNLPRALDPNAKLAGSALGDFGAFFSRAWRTNDWWWGRADAAAGMVRTIGLLADASDGHAPELPEEAATRMPAELQEQVLRQANVSGPGVRPYPDALPPTADAEQIAAKLTAGGHSLAQLRPAYLVSVANRAVRLTVRGLRSGQSILVRSAVSLLLPPLLIVVPFVFASVRAAFAVTAAFAILQFLVPPSPAAGAGAGWILFGVGAAVWLTQGAAVISRWRRMRQLALFGPGRPFGVLRARALRACRRSGGLLALGSGALAAMAIRNATGRAPDPGLFFLLAAVIVTALAAQLASASLAAPGWRSSTIAWGGLTLVAALVVMPGALWWIDLLHGAAPAPVQTVLTFLHQPACEVGLTAAIAYAAVTFGWFGMDSSQAVARIGGVAKWLLGTAAVGAGAGATTFLFLSLVNAPAGHATFSQGLAAGVLAWFVGAHLGWWWGELFSHRFPVIGADRPKF
jgi:predicted acylesterase/phospholipase RssA